MLSRFRLSARVLLPVAGLGLAACTSAPAPDPPAVAHVDSFPAGALCVTDEGEVFQTPAEIPYPNGGILRFDVRLDGHEPRRIALHPANRRETALESLTAFLPVRMLASNGWERVDAPKGQTTLELTPTESDDTEGDDKE